MVRARRGTELLAGDDRVIDFAREVALNAPNGTIWSTVLGPQPVDRL